MIFGKTSQRCGASKPWERIGTPHYMAPEIMRGHGYGTEVRMVQQRDGGFFTKGKMVH